jgi:hypothetical protein
MDLKKRRKGRTSVKILGYINIPILACIKFGSEEHVAVGCHISSGRSDLRSIAEESIVLILAWFRVVVCEVNTVAGGHFGMMPRSQPIIRQKRNQTRMF